MSKYNCATLLLAGLLLAGVGCTSYEQKVVIDLTPAERARIEQLKETQAALPADPLPWRTAKEWRIDGVPDDITCAAYRERIIEQISVNEKKYPATKYEIIDVFYSQADQDCLYAIRTTIYLRGDLAGRTRIKYGLFALGSARELEGSEQDFPSNQIDELDVSHKSNFLTRIRQYK